jgi:hypothetical protein
MKTVRYAAGAAIGLTPLVAFGVPGAPHAAPTLARTPSATMAKTKTVSAHVTPAATRGVCAGQTFAQTRNNDGEGGWSQSVAFYWAWSAQAQYACIGTVEGGYIFLPGLNGPAATSWRVRIRDAETGSILSHSTTQNITVTDEAHGERIYFASLPFRAWYPVPVMVCGAWLNDGTVIGPDVPCDSVY